MECNFQITVTNWKFYEKTCHILISVMMNNDVLLIFVSARVDFVYFFEYSSRIYLLFFSTEVDFAYCFEYSSIFCLLFGVLKYILTTFWSTQVYFAYFFKYSSVFCLLF